MNNGVRLVEQRLIAGILLVALLLGWTNTIWPSITHAQSQTAPNHVDWEKVIGENELSRTVASRLLRGIAFANLGQLPRALKELEIAGEDGYREEVAEFVLDNLRQLRRSPEDLLLLNCAAFGSYAFGDLEQSISYFEEIIRLAPTVAWSRNFCAIVCGQTGEIERAQVHLERALKLDPKNQYTHLLLSAIYKEKGQYIMALFHYLQAPDAISELRRHGVL